MIPKAKEICEKFYTMFKETDVCLGVCGDEIKKLAQNRGNDKVNRGDGDPLDICVLSSHHIPHGDILLKAIPIGGFCLIDKGEADDKIIAVLVGDQMYANYQDISELPSAIMERLRHYFLTYKSLPNEKNVIEISQIYDRKGAYEVIEKAQFDYKML